MTDYISVRGNKVYCKHTGNPCLVVRNPKDLEGFEGCDSSCDIPIEIHEENVVEMGSYKDYPDEGEW